MSSLQNKIIFKYSKLLTFYIAVRTTATDDNMALHLHRGDIQISPDTYSTGQDLILVVVPSQIVKLAPPYGLYSILYYIECTHVLSADTTLGCPPLLTTVAATTLFVRQALSVRVHFSVLPVSYLNQLLKKLTRTRFY